MADSKPRGASVVNKTCSICDVTSGPARSAHGQRQTASEDDRLLYKSLTSPRAEMKSGEQIRKAPKEA